MFQYWRARRDCSAADAASSLADARDRTHGRCVRPTWLEDSPRLSNSRAACGGGREFSPAPSKEDSHELDQFWNLARPERFELPTPWFVDGAPTVTY